MVWHDHQARWKSPHNYLLANVLDCILKSLSQFRKCHMLKHVRKYYMTYSKA